MAAQPLPAPAPSSTGLSHPLSVFGPQYCASYVIDLSLVRKFWSLSEGTFVVSDVKDNVIFKVKGKFLTIHDRRVLLDAADHPICNFKAKVFSAHDKWEVFRGEGSEETDLIFTAQRSKVLQLKTKLQVFLASNKSEVPNFLVEGSYSERSCVVFAADGTTIVAQMHKKTTLGSELLGKDKFNVTVYPNMDYAFVTAIVVILDGINKEV